MYYILQCHNLTTHLMRAHMVPNLNVVTARERECAQPASVRDAYSRVCMCAASEGGGHV